MSQRFHFYSLSEKALTIEIGKAISEENHQRIMSLRRFIEKITIPGFIETVPAYCSLTIYYNPAEVAKKIPERNITIFRWMHSYLEKELGRWQLDKNLSDQDPVIEIPVCYDEDFGIDLEEVANYHKTTAGEVIRIHSSVVYTVFMMGFSPGFPYLGTLPDTIATPRKNRPRPKVAAGSVAIAGNQTGIYPLESPGGWNIIGRTPLRLFNKNQENPFLFSTGNKVKFIPLSKKVFNELLSK
jgi:inhibitor of KinA